MSGQKLPYLAKSNNDLPAALDSSYKAANGRQTLNLDTSRMVNNHVSTENADQSMGPVAANAGRS